MAAEPTPDDRADVQTPISAGLEAEGGPEAEAGPEDGGRHGRGR